MVTRSNYLILLAFYLRERETLIKFKKIQEIISLFSPVKRIIVSSINIEAHWAYGFALTFTMLH